MDRKIIRISKDGLAVSALYADLLCGLGEQSVVRASHVEFDNAAQGWVVRIALGPDAGRMLPGVFSSRKEALSAEVEFLNEQLEKGLI
jgi:hypothetical protein